MSIHPPARTQIAGISGLQSALNARESRTAFQPSAALYDSYDRRLPSTQLAAATSGTLLLTPIDLPSGVAFNRISFVCRTTALGSGTHQWFGVFDSNRNKLALTADDTTTAWAANTVKTLALSTWTTTYSGLHFLGCMVEAGTMPTLFGMSSTSGLIQNLTPAIAGSSTAALTDPASCPSQVAAPTGGTVAYAYISLV